MIEVEEIRVNPVIRGIGVEARNTEQIEIIGNKPLIIPKKKNYGDLQDSVRENVRSIVNGYDLALKNYLILYLEYLNFTGQGKITEGKEDLIIRLPKTNILNITSPESVSRALRQLIEAKEVELDEESQHFRKVKEEELRSYFGQLKSEY